MRSGIAPVALHDGRPANVQLADLSLAAATRPSSVTANTSTSGDRLSRSGSVRRLVGRARGTSYQVHTFVSVGPKRFANRARGRSCISLTQVLRREHLAGEEDRAQRGQLRLVQPAAQHEHREDRRHRVPDRDRGVADERGELDREDAELLRDEHDRRAGLRGGEQVEDREVEVERRVAREAVLLRDAELLGRPVDERTSR